jgi:hypothetical protein
MNLYNFKPYLSQHKCISTTKIENIHEVHGDIVTYLLTTAINILQQHNIKELKFYAGSGYGA